MLSLFVFLLLAFLPYCSCLTKVIGRIPSNLDIEEGSISVSGVSAGAAMATQLHVAHSADIMGVATFAGSGPYYCAAGSLTFALGRCMATPANIPTDSLIEETDRFATAGDIDDTTNLQGSKVFIWHGIYDDTVAPGASVAIDDYYLHYGADIKFACVNRFAAGHAQPVEGDIVGVTNPCADTASPYINNCDYDGAFNALDHIYGGIQRPERPIEATGTLIQFDQGDHVLNPTGISLADDGYMYVPTACETEQCKLHIALHGCLMTYDTIGDDYVMNGGYNEVADANNIVILYPQATSSFVPNNPNGCFDWWGYNDGLASEYTTKNGAQVKAIWSMLGEAARYLQK